MTLSLIEDRYRVIESLGKGGMGEVSRVLDITLGREVALKRLLVGSDREKAAAALELFEREFHTLSELSHPRIIEVYDYGVTEDGAYYTMELLTGSDLRSMGQVPWSTACSLLRDLASSLAIIHSRRLVHADLSPRNVRCTGDGRAKLLDFGAMMPMGPCRRIVGTPPFLAPETLNGLPLDGRTDLFGFGALAYWILTGRNAYPARELAELPQHWAGRLRSPRELEATVPEWFSDLVMECLQLDRSLRPRTAGVVMDRICRLASLPLEEHREVAAAYLTTPTLVGRGEQLAKVRRKVGGESGGLLIVEGVGGSGRSRFLDACALEAKLSGRKVVRVAAAESGSEAYAAARSLVAQLVALGPASLRDTPVPATAPDQLEALGDFVGAISSALPLLVAVDDADRIDEDSKGLLLSIAQRTGRQTPCIVLTIDAAGEGSVALDALRRHGETLSLLPLVEQETEQLVQSIFGAVTHSVSVARRLHTAAAGRPKVVLQLAAQLVERGIVRYEAGSFVLPEWIADDELPQTLSAALARRLSALGADAAELACVLSLTDARELPMATYPELTSHRERRRAFRAVDELVRAEFLVADGDRYRVENEAWRDVVSKALAPEAQRELHARLARQFESTGKVNRRAYHLASSGDAKAAALVLLAQFIKDPNEPRDPLEDYIPGALDFLEEMADASGKLDIDGPCKVELRMKTLGASQFVGDIRRFERLSPPLLERLKRDSGLTDYEELKEANPSATVFEAFGRVQARFDAVPEHERGLALPDAMREVARLCVMHAGVAAISTDVSIARRIPDLTPLAMLSPAIGAIKQMLDGMRAVVEGRSNVARERFLALLSRLDDPDRAGLGELYHRSLRLGALYVVGLAEAAAGIPTALERAAHLENEPGHRVNAQRIYMTSLLMRGDVEGAAVAQRRAEVLMLQEARYQRYPGTTARSELQACFILEDVAGVKELTERFTSAAVDYPKLGVYADVARYFHRRLQGDFAGALAALEPALEGTAPLEHREWPPLAAAHVHVLADLGRTEEALRLGREYVERCRRLDLHPGVSQVLQSVARALLASGQPRDAGTIVDELVAECLRANSRGLPLGVLYELRARIALAEQDEPGFESALQLCREEFRAHAVPALAAKVQRLVREARRAMRTSIGPMQHPDVEANLLTVAGAPLTEALFADEDPGTRIASVIEVVAQSLEPRPDAAFLFAVSDGHARFLKALPSVEPTADIVAAAESFLELRDEEDDCHTMTAFVDPEAPATVAASGETRTDFVHAIPLTCTEDGRIAGVAVVRTAAIAATLPAHLADVLGRALLEAEQIRIARTA